MADPELLRLPDPPRRERSLTVATLGLTALASLAMVVSLRGDALYAVTASSRPVDLGELGAAGDGAFVENSYVAGTVMLGAAHAIKFERPFVASSFRLMPVAGRPNVWVELHVSPGAETARYVPPSQVTGHLVRFESAGLKHRGLSSALRDATGQHVDAASWLLVEDEAPASARWAVALVVMFFGFALWNVAVVAKLLRKVR